MKYIKLLVFAAILLLCSIEMASCNGNDEPSKQNYDGTPLVILDTDIGSSTDDLFALEMFLNFWQLKLLFLASHPKYLNMMSKMGAKINQASLG